MRHLLLSAGLVALCAVLWPARAESAPILYSFSGQVSVSTGSSPAAIGAAIAGTFNALAAGRIRVCRSGCDVRGRVS
jgi:hypothetical protein